MRKYIWLFACLLSTALSAQHQYYQQFQFTEADTLRGKLEASRSAYDVHFYDLNITVDIERRYLKGYVDMAFEVAAVTDRIQVDLYENMQLNRVEYEGKELSTTRKYDAFFVHFPESLDKGTNATIRMYYEGAPTVARNAPWDGGFVWKEDEKGNPWVGVACEGDGASLWWPCKDHLSDEPDSMMIRVAVPNDLMCIANGDLVEKQEMNDDYTRYDWRVTYPINSYNVTVNIADYTQFSDTYTAEDGEELRLDYYVLSYNLARAKKHFAQVPQVLACFEKFFGKYPFWEDGFALVETPYLGMEHQSAIAYGNKYMRGYLGGLIPRDMDWDYIIVHETGHEYFGNAVSINDMAEMWIHESFTTYMETLFVECAYSYEDAVRYINSQRNFIDNKLPILGPLDVNFDDWGGSDHYYKGAWMLHTLRHAIGDDELWFDLLRSFYNRYAIGHAKTKDFIDYVSLCTKKDYAPFFEQYLYHPNVPVLQYKLTEKKNRTILEYRWKADIAAFAMPVLVGEKGEYIRVEPTTDWQKTKLPKMDDFSVATELFYVKIEQMDESY
ncbi:MAG: M1 family metallopeptidase [Bacteroidota bacterium]